MKSTADVKCTMFTNKKKLERNGPNRFEQFKREKNHFRTYTELRVYVSLTNNNKA